MTSESGQPMVRKCYENLCRLCLGTDKLLQITTNEKIKNEIKKFIALDYIEIDIEDQLPNILCEKCLEKLRTWHQFKQKCLENYDILVKIIEDQTSNQSNHVNSEESDLEKYNDIKDRTKRQSKNKSKQCPICGVFLKDLKTHLLQHDDPEGKPFRCITCGKSYCRRIGLKLHVEREHLKIRYTCEKCAKICSTKTILKEHQKLHSDETNYKCDQCDKEFKSYKYLFKHKQWHAGIKKFVCSYCGKAFRVGESLKQHIRVHTGEKPYSCKDCEKCFQTPHHLKQHSRVHTGAKPFKCSFCDTCFGNKKSRDNHQNLHPEVESSKCNEYRVITVLPEMTESTNIQYESLEKNKNQILYIM